MKNNKNSINIDKPSLLTPTNLSRETDEINLLDLLLVLVKHKMLIIGMVFFTGVAAVVISLLMTNIYRSEATIALRPESKASASPLSGLGGLGGMVAGQLGLNIGGTLEKLEMVLLSRNLTKRVINKYKLMPIIFFDKWDATTKQWTNDDPPTFQDAWKKINENMLQIKADSNNSSISVGFEHENPETTQKIVENYITELSETMREAVLFDATEKMRFFREQLNKTSDTLLREKIYILLANEIEKETFARAQKYYGFVVLDPPIVPDPDKKVKPKRALICILSVSTAFFAAIFLSFLIEFIHRLKIDDPERYQEIVQGLTLRRMKKK